MSARPPERIDLTPEEQAFVRRVDELYAAPDLSAEERVAFQARLDARRSSPRRGWVPATLAGAAVVAAGSALLVLTFTRAELADDEATPRIARQEAATTLAAATPEEALLALATEGVADADEGLPEDYLAIEGVLLGG